MTEYEKKLTDPEWQRKRLEVMQRDKWACQACGMTTMQLEVHHTDYWSNMKPWQYPADMLITLCHGCHQMEKSRHKHEKYLIQSFKL